MLLVLIKLVARLFVFGVALTYCTRRSRDVRIEPRTALPVVAAVFTVLNVVLYALLSTALNIGTLGLLFFVVPFAANALILLITDRLVKPFKIESMTALARTAGIVTLAYFLLKLARL